MPLVWSACLHEVVIPLLAHGVTNALKIWKRENVVVKLGQGRKGRFRHDFQNCARFRRLKAAVHISKFE